MRVKGKPVGEQLVDSAATSLLACPDPGERQASTPWHDFGDEDMLDEHFASELLDCHVTRGRRRFEPPTDLMETFTVSSTSPAYSHDRPAIARIDTALVGPDHGRNRDRHPLSSP
jgi:hypothetical protein